MRIRLIFNQGQGQAGNQAALPFQGFAAKGAPWGSFWCSLCIHAAAAWFVTSYVDFVARHPSPAPDVRAARVLELNVNPIEEFRPILAPAPSAEQPANSGDRRKGRASFQARVSKRSVKQEADRAETPKDTDPSRPPAAPAIAARELREFKMPPARVKQAVPQTLVQLDLPPTLDLHQSLRTPTLVVLAAMPRNLAPKPFVASPERRRIMEVPSQVALEMRPPILDVRPGYAKPPEIVSQFTPRLPVPVGALAPVAASNQDPVEVMPAASTVAGNAVAESTTIISLPDRPIPVASTIVLPPLNQVADRDSASGVAGPENSSLGKAAGAKTGAGDSKPAAQSQAAGSAGAGVSRGVGGENLARNPAGGSGSSQLASSAGNKSGPASSSANSGSQPGAGSGAGTLPGSGSRPGNGSSGDDVSNSASSSGGSSSGSSGTGTTSLPARVIRSRDGQYDLAIVQSSGVIPGSSGLLKGRPVYSVYLSVGAGNEWVLQYCLPSDETAKPTQAAVVQIGAVTPVAAPYAFAILRPVIRFRAGARYAFIHGFVSASGQFERLTEAGEPMIENMDAVLENLQQWEFRPASKDGQPAVVEILLCIPNIA